MGRTIADGLSNKATATAQEARDGVAGKYPDAAGVIETLKKFGVSEELEFLGNIDLDTLIDTGFYYVGGGSGSANLPATGTTFVQVLASADGGERVFQLAKTVANNSPLYFRSAFGGVWSRWFTLFSHNSILGTVSQSSGSPTGALIERGSNANGEYVKYADGTLTMTRSIAQYDNTIAVGAELYLGTGNNVAIFPITNAVSIDSVSVEGSCFDSGGTRVLGAFLQAYQQSTDRWNFYIDNYNGSATIESVRLIKLTAHGRWF